MALTSLITSQIDTAPKLREFDISYFAGLITSQIDTAPKRYAACDGHRRGLITSQIDTAPKRLQGAHVAVGQERVVPYHVLLVPEVDVGIRVALVQ